MTAKSRREDLAARARATMAGSTPQPRERTGELTTAAGDEQTGAADARKAPPAPRVKAVRLVVELQPVEHRALRRVADRMAEDLDLPSVAMAEIMRTLLELVQEDDGVARKTAEKIRRSGGDRRR